MTAASRIFNSNLDSDKIEELCIAFAIEQPLKRKDEKRVYMFADESCLVINRASRPCAVSVYNEEDQV